MSEQAALLKKALIQGVSERYAAELAASEKNVVCSKAHLQKMSEILGVDVTEKANKWKFTVAAILIAAALALCCLTAYAYRDEIRDFFVRIFEEYIVLEFPGEQAPGGIEENYKVGYVPEGYTLATEIVDETKTYIQWQNLNEDSLIFKQRSLNAEFRFDEDYVMQNVITHHDLEILCLYYDNYAYYTWNDGRYALSIYDSCLGLTAEEIIKMIDSIYADSQNQQSH